MKANIVGALVAFLLGAVIAWLNYLFSRYVLERHPSRYSWTTMVRQIVQVAYLIVLFFLGVYTPWDRLWILVGGCLGITIPMTYFTYRLVRFNDSLRGKGDDSDG